MQLFIFPALCTAEITWTGTDGSCAQCWSANVKVPRALLLAAKPVFDANPDGGSMITTGSIAVCLAHTSHSIRLCCSAS